MTDPRNIAQIVLEIGGKPAKTLANICNECGGAPAFVLLGGTFRLRAIGCTCCRARGPARMSDEDAIVEWNKGRRLDRFGHIEDDGS